MTIGSRAIPDADIASIRLTPSIVMETVWRVEAVQKTGPPLVCASGDYDAMMDTFLWAGYQLSKLQNDAI
jgi:hypothetical protein